MDKEQTKSKSDMAVAWKWAQWPTFFGIFVGISLTRDVFDKVTKPHSIFDELLMGALFCAIYAAVLGGITFGAVLVILKIKRYMLKRS